jgi:HSP20 family protein
MLPLIKRRPETPMRRRSNPLLNLREEMDDLFDRFTRGWMVPDGWTEMRDWDVEEKENEVVMRLEIPGFEANELELSVEDNVFVVRAVHAEEGERDEKGENEADRSARASHRFEYRFTLPFGTDVNAIAASYRNGVLELHLPRLPEAKPRRIELKT